MDVVSHPQLRSDVELVSGFDGEFLLHVESEGRYIRLGAAAAGLIRYFDGTKTVYEIALELVAGRDIDIQVVQSALQRLVGNLAQAGLLDGVPREVNTSFSSWFSRTPTKRFPILDAKATARFIRPATALIELLRPSALLILIISLIVILGGALLGALTLRHVNIYEPWAPLVSLLICFLATVLHEASHAIVCHSSGYPVRSLGVAFWYYFIPVAYVDRTDTYRVRSRVARAAISLAGPASDMFWCAVASIGLLSDVVDSSSIIGQISGGCIFFFMVGLVGNFNPLLPSDGQQTIETAFGMVNLRNRAISYALGEFSAQKSDYLSAPTHKTVRLVYLIYGTVCCLYLLLVGVMMVWSIASVLSFFI